METFGRTVAGVFWGIFLLGAFIKLVAAEIAQDGLLAIVTLTIGLALGAAFVRLMTVGYVRVSAS